MDGDRDRGAGGERPNLRPETAAQQRQKEDRLARQLRANLSKRKQQQRARRTGTDAGASSESGTGSGGDDPGPADG